MVEDDAESCSFDESFGSLASAERPEPDTDAGCTPVKVLIYILAVVAVIAALVHFGYPRKRK